MKRLAWLLSNPPTEIQIAGLNGWAEVTPMQPSDPALLDADGLVIDPEAPIPDAWLSKPLLMLSTGAWRRFRVSARKWEAWYPNSLATTKGKKCTLGLFRPSGRGDSSGSR